MKKKVNCYKVGALVLMLIEVGIMLFTKKETLQNLNTWRLYLACIMCIPINIMFICTKKGVNK